MNAPVGRERPQRLKRIGLYGLRLFLAGCAQCGFFATLSFLPATPDLILGCLLAIALLDSPRVALVAALPAGFFLEAIGGSGLSLSPLVYCLILAVMSLWVEKLLPRFLSYAVLLAPAALLRAVCSVLERLAEGGLPTVGALLLSCLWSILCTAVLCLPLYGLTRLVRIPLVKKSKFSF